MKRCTRCIMPETQEAIRFNEEGVCNLCEQYERKQAIDWDARERMLLEILDKYRGRGRYDCLIPYSGGKDSSFQAYIMVKKYRMKPLLYTFHHTNVTKTGLYNMFNTTQKLGLEHILYTPDKHVVRKLMLLALKEYGDWCWYCHSGIYGNTIQVAVCYDTPLIIWGESNAEYQQYYTLDDFEEIDYDNFTRFKQSGIGYERFVGKMGLTEQDLEPFKFPSPEEINQLKPVSMHLGSYVKWDTYKQVELIKRELDWRDAPVEGSHVTHDKQECRFIGVRDYCKYLKRGFGRTTHLASIDVREGRISREEALRLEEKYDGKRPASVDAFLDEIGLTEPEFMDILQQHTVEPWRGVRFEDRPETGPFLENTLDPLRD